MAEMITRKNSYEEVDAPIHDQRSKHNLFMTCPSCSHQIQCEQVFLFLPFSYLSLPPSSSSILVSLEGSKTKTGRNGGWVFGFWICRGELNCQGFLQGWGLFLTTKSFWGIWRERWEMILVSIILSLMSLSLHLKGKMEFAIPTQRSFQVHLLIFIFFFNQSYLLL